MEEGRLMVLHPHDPDLEPDPADAAAWGGSGRKGTPPPNGEDTEPAAPERIDGDWWLNRPIERPAPLLGEVICATTRALLGGPTGAGKTHVAMAMAGAMATSRGFLHWLGPARPRTVLYIDGEMARDLIQDRMRDLHRRLGGASLANLHLLCREDFSTMQALNTPDGQAFVLAAVDQLKPDVVFLDNRMALLVGDMKDEIPWTETMPLVLALTRRRIAQIWIDHTGHDASHIYGSKTKEWQMDVVMLVEEAAAQPDADISLKLRFIKARRRRPETREDFAPITITLRNDEWTWLPAEPGAERPTKGRPMSDATELLRRAIHHLASDKDVVLTVVQTGMPAVRAVSLGNVKRHLMEEGWFTETVHYQSGKGPDDFPRLTKSGHNRMANALATLKRRGICGYNRSFVWPA
jgi:hypothetical protein